MPTFDALMHSRELGAKVQFTDQGAGFYGDCPSAAHGVSPVDQCRGLFFAAVVALVSTAAASANANGLAVANLLKLPSYTGTVWDWSIVAAVCLSSILIFWMARVIGRLLLGRKLRQRPEMASHAETEEPRDDRRI